MWLNIQLVLALEEGKSCWKFVCWVLKFNKKTFRNNVKVYNTLILQNDFK
jgi:hypothetical protein